MEVFEGNMIEILNEEFVRWIDSSCVDGVQKDAIKSIITKLSPERLDELMVQNAYFYPGLAKSLGLTIRE